MPKGLIGLIPMPAASRMLVTPISSIMKRRNRSASSDPEAHSIPAYTSSVFSRKMTTSSLSGSFMGEGTP